MARQLVLEIVCLLAVLLVKESCNSLLPDTAHCGQSFENRIYGGSETHIHEYPWTVLMRVKPPKGKTNTCGGSLINNRYVLTAGHCLVTDGFKKNSRKNPIRLGEWNRETDPDCETLKNGKKICADPHVDVGIEKTILHPDYCRKDKIPVNDIALIRLDRYINFTNFIQPVCLPVQQHLRKEKFVGKSMYIVGWGHTEKANKTSQMKRKATIVGVDLNKCRQAVSKFNFSLSDSQMCAGGEVGVSQCSGDSGGPLVSQERVDNRDVYVLAGIISCSKKPCGSRYPGVFARVGSYMGWILDNLKK